MRVYPQIPRPYYYYYWKMTTMIGSNGDNSTEPVARVSCWVRSRKARETGWRLVVIYLVVLADHWGRGADLGRAARWAVPGALGVLLSALGARVGDRNTTYPGSFSDHPAANRGES